MACHPHHRDVPVCKEDPYTPRHHHHAPVRTLSEGVLRWGHYGYPPLDPQGPRAPGRPPMRGRMGSFRGGLNVGVAGMSPSTRNRVWRPPQ